MPKKKKYKNAKQEKPTLTTPTFFDFCQTPPGRRILENFTEGNLRKLKSKPNRRQKISMFE